jgi:aromatic-L-amino-acid/L-tryptophan decarboxylase
MTDNTPAHEIHDDASLDPNDWDQFAHVAHQMLDDALANMRSSRDGRVWSPAPKDLKSAFDIALPREGSEAALVQRQIAELLHFGVGNTHPRFFGWVHGAGSPGNLIADIAASAMNANLGGRDHGAMYVEKQVVRWVREMFGFPAGSSGLIVSGTSIATIVALKTARDSILGFQNRKTGEQPAGMVGYTSTQTHSCVARAFDLLGLGSDALRQIPVDDQFRMDTHALENAISKDRADGLIPFVIIGTAGSVNVGAIDDIASLSRISKAEDLWLHIDGAFGAAGVLSDILAPSLRGLERVDSIAFDFHKWLHVNYDAGFVLIRDAEKHRRAFAERPDYLKGAERGLAAGNPWPVDFGPELSRGFRALKIWEQFTEHGTEKLGQMISKNCRQAAHLAALVRQHSQFELLAPVATSICCFRFVAPLLDIQSLNALNEEIAIELQIGGAAVTSTTTINDKTALRVNITNHRTRFEDIEILLSEISAVANRLNAQ